tara:strand:+ start:1368 stop:1988 length:621 start_codon:yes stop_codon:yes gene_type:complete
MFFIRQYANMCGLHAIQNLFKSCHISAIDMHNACLQIFEETTDPVSNHESFGGNWSVSAVLRAITMAGYRVDRAIKTQEKRIWTAPFIPDLMKNPKFRGIIIHQPHRHHFACMRVEMVDGKNKLYFVDSQSSGPICISPTIAMQRCIETAYMWEAYIIMGDPMEYVAPSPLSSIGSINLNKRQKTKPSEEFLKSYHSLKKHDKLKF